LGLSRPAHDRAAARREAHFVPLAGRTLMRRAEVERIAACAEAWCPDAGHSAKADIARRPALLIYGGKQVFG